MHEYKENAIFCCSNSNCKQQITKSIECNIISQCYGEENDHHNKSGELSEHAEMRSDNDENVSVYLFIYSRQNRILDCIEIFSRILELFSSHKILILYFFVFIIEFR